MSTPAMCGIAAIYAYHYAALEADREELRLIRDAMKTRGPDGEGEWYSENRKVALGHRRLAIIDPSERARQPMQNQAGTVVISFNGEIYNYRELRLELEKKGRVFKSQSDTEVLIHLYEEKGVGMLQDLRGMFVFAIWDAQKKAMLLARDPYGIKPLYYADDGWTLRVASQVKALLQSEKVSRLPEPAGIAGFFMMGSVPEPFTLYQEIRQLPAGSFMWVDELGPSSPKKYFSLVTSLRGGEADEAISRSLHPLGARNDEEIREALLDSVRHHFVSDVPVGIFLSGGIDSGSLMALATEAGIRNIETITLAFEEYQGQKEDEAPLAQEVSSLFGGRHNTRRLSRKEFLNDLPQFFEAMDQPTIDGVNTYFVSKAAAELKLKVTLSGLGGDELFGGYSSFQDIPRIVKALAIPSRIPFLGDFFQKGPGPFFSHPKMRGLVKYGGSYAGAYFLKRGLFMPWELDSVLDQETIHEGLARLKLFELIKETIKTSPQNDFARVRMMESSLYMRNQLLRDSDWAGMTHSLEIRTPFVDVVLSKALGSKVLSKKTLIENLKKSLPDQVLKRPKTGFSVPMKNWLEEGQGIDSWKKIPSLGRPECPWARRWAYVVMERQKGIAPVLEKVS